MNRKTITEDQITSAILQADIDTRINEQMERLAEIQQVASQKMQEAGEILNQGLGCIENIRDFVANPNHILGSDRSKHGEIAEQIEVQIRKGRAIMDHMKPTATFEGVGRTAPEDYIIDGMPVQSKFINYCRGSLEHVLEHVHKYPDFANSGFYHIPKDQYAILEKIYNGESVEELSSRSVNACKKLIQQIEAETGNPFCQVVKPGISNYSDVQVGQVDKTLNNYEAEFNDQHRAEVKDIRQEWDRAKEEVEHMTDLSWGEALKYSAISAGITGLTSAGITIYSKIHNGKKITEFSLDDWKDVGYDFSKGAIKGGISGIGIYGLTKLGGFSAPFAGAVVSTAVGISFLLYDYKIGKISENEFADSACALSIEAGLAAIGASIGQMLIPVPVLGAIVGSAAANAALKISRHICSEHEAKLIRNMEAEYEKLMKSLNAECEKIIRQMDRYYSQLGGYINAALSPVSAVRFYGSIELCKFLKVPETDIIHSINELDRYMFV